MNLSKTNQKGQIVIPKDIRDILKIDDSVMLLIKQYGKNIVLTPVDSIVPNIRTDSNLKDILNQTRGSWGTSEKEDTQFEIHNKKIEKRDWKERNVEW